MPTFPAAPLSHLENLQIPMSSPLSRPIKLECLGLGPSSAGGSFCWAAMLENHSVTAPPGLWAFTMALPWLPLHIPANSLSVFQFWSSESKMGLPRPNAGVGRAGPFCSSRKNLLPCLLQLWEVPAVLGAALPPCPCRHPGCHPFGSLFSRGSGIILDDLPHGRSAREQP